MRPAWTIVPALQAIGATVQAFDPEGHEARQLLPGVDFTDGPYEAHRGRDALVIVTEWDEFRALDLDRVKRRWRNRCWSTCATSTDPTNCAPPASPISASAGADRAEAG